MLALFIRKEGKMSKTKGRGRMLIALPAMLGLVLSLGLFAVPANGVPTITGNYVPSDGLHIKTKGRLNATSIGIGYPPGKGARTDCYAKSGDWVTRKYSWGSISSSIWASARDLDTQVKGYSSVVWTTFPDTLTSNTPSGFVKESKDTCWFSGKAGLY
jgi:hypothetical protein